MTDLPEMVAPYAGRIIDVDSHEMVPSQLWVEELGEDMRPLAEYISAQKPTNLNHASCPGYEGDVLDIDPATIWTTKGVRAPGAKDVSRRLEVMDAMHIDRQLMFPTAPALMGLSMTTTSRSDTVNYDEVSSESREAGSRVLRCANEWLIESAKVSPRIRPVPILAGDTPRALLAEAMEMIGRGVRAVLLSPGMLPGGVSPAHDDLDPLYALLSEANVALTFHIIGTEHQTFLRSAGWGDAPAFEGYRIFEEISMTPWRLSILALPVQNFVATMVVGGVLDRHPDLRVGSLELSATWIGPLAEMLDLWHDNNQAIEPKQFMDGQARYKLPMRPSEYIQRNVRVSPFHFEPVGAYIARYGLEEVYCFASDYPHMEGGKDPIGSFAKSLSDHGHGAKVFEKFFVTNGEWLLPA